MFTTLRGSPACSRKNETPARRIELVHLIPNVLVDVLQPSSNLCRNFRLNCSFTSFKLHFLCKFIFDAGNIFAISFVERTHSILEHAVGVVGTTYQKMDVWMQSVEHLFVVEPVSFTLGIGCKFNCFSPLSRCLSFRRCRASKVEPTPGGTKRGLTPHSSWETTKFFVWHRRAQGFVFHWCGASG